MKLRRQLAKKKRIETYRGASYVIEDDGTKTGPICQSCYQTDDVTVLLESANGGAGCPRCKTRYPGISPAVEGFRQTVF